MDLWHGPHIILDTTDFAQIDQGKLLQETMNFRKEIMHDGCSCSFRKREAFQKDRDGGNIIDDPSKNFHYIDEVLYNIIITVPCFPTYKSVKK